MANTTKNFKVGDTVLVLNPIRLPRVEQVIDNGHIERITQSSSGEPLYWVSCRKIAVTARVLRHATYRLPSGEVVTVDATATKGAEVIDFQLADGSMVKATAVHDAN